ncbi:ABC transporter ATP-binding protein [Staphylococcus edaphicus]|uniref:ABC transporter ATP-binding protein n=1 Tax=Staphylococcus edaphicus TaxID=1955013 RepID=A0A2C6WQW2_9STAP|nr:ABC transporter ATP-binding protein [Staphylococcus edaphicus]PHK50136.1 peptide ABC transporter ATP-binding protein [Staphylococcus edaphicus]UQW81634.1 ABC transporter ATP-binding protein [Staphylococcus edaphicus]
MLKVSKVTKSYQSTGLFRHQRQQILQDVNLECPMNTTIGIIGESGSGKSTLGRLILGIEKPDLGSVTLNGRPMYQRRVRKQQMSAVFQDYISSLHPFHTVQMILSEVLRFSGEWSKDKRLSQSIQLLEEVGLSKDVLNKYPNMLSGGEAQRVAIARSICLNPKYILLDEAISSLDMSIQTQILDLLIHLKEQRQLSYIFITHDIQVATYLCDRLVIFKNGTIVTQIDTCDLHRTTHPYTRALIDKQLTF